MGPEAVRSYNMHKFQPIFLRLRRGRGLGLEAYALCPLPLSEPFSARQSVFAAIPSNKATNFPVFLEFLEAIRQRWREGYPSSSE